MQIRSILALAAVALATLAAPHLVATAESCNPYPIGRCGASDRENVAFCYLPGKPAGVYISGTDKHVLMIGSDDLAVSPTNLPNPERLGADDVAAMETDRNGRAYVRLAPSERFADDPWNADLPFGTFWQETNSASGLQTGSVKCGQFIWFAECDSWMGPYSIATRPPDALVI